MAAALDVSVTLPPLQKVVGPEGVIVGDGAAICVTAVVAEVPLQPAPVVTETL